MSGRYSRRLRLVVPLCFIVIFAVRFPLEARTQKILAVRTQLRPVNWPKNVLLWFAPGICWLDDFDGGVESGTMDQPADLKIWNSNGLVSFGPGFIRFERAGGVKEGTLLEDASLCVVNTTSKTKKSLKFKGKKTVEFGYDGCVMKGTLAQEAILNSEDDSSKTYPPGTLIDFDGAGRVMAAVLPPSSPSPPDGGTDKPILRLDLSPFDNLRANQTYTLTATVENIPSMIKKVQFLWYFYPSKCISADPPAQFVSFCHLQFIAPANGKATCSITIQAENKPGPTTFQFSVQQEPYVPGFYLHATKDYTIR